MFGVFLGDYIIIILRREIFLCRIVLRGVLKLIELNFMGLYVFSYCKLLDRLLVML